MIIPTVNASCYSVETHSVLQERHQIKEYDCSKCKRKICTQSYFKLDPLIEKLETLSKL